MKLTKSRLKQIIKEELDYIVENPPPGDKIKFIGPAQLEAIFDRLKTENKIPEEFIRFGEASLQNFKERYPKVINDLGRPGEQELSRKFAEEQFNSAMGGNERVKPGELERILLQLLNDGWERSFFPTGGDFDETN